MFKKIYLHIGPHKTGSSYLQKFLLENSKILIDNGIFYPDLSDERGDGHHNLAKPIFIKKELKSYLNSLEVKKNNSLLLSAENFSRLSNKDIKELYNILAEFTDNIQVLIFIRNPSSVLRSLWCESIKHGSFRSHSDFLVEHFAFPKKSKILNPEILFKNFSQYFNVSLIDYDSINFKSVTSLASVFLDSINIGGKYSFTNYEVNKSFSLAESEIYRNINISLSKESGEEKILPQKDFKKFIIDNKLNTHIDEANKNILSLDFMTSSSAVPYKKFLGEYKQSFLNKPSNPSKFSKLDIILSYNSYIELSKKVNTLETKIKNLNDNIKPEYQGFVHITKVEGYHYDKWCETKTLIYFKPFESIKVVTLEVLNPANHEGEVTLSINDKFKVKHTIKNITSDLMIEIPKGISHESLLCIETDIDSSVENDERNISFVLNNITFN